MPALQLLLLLFFTSVAVSHWIYSWVLLAPCLITGMVMIRSPAQKSTCRVILTTESDEVARVKCRIIAMLNALSLEPNTMSGAQVQEPLPCHIFFEPAPDTDC